MHIHRGVHVRRHARALSSAGPHQVYTGPNTRVVTNAASATSTCRRWQSRCQVARNGYGDGSISSQPAARFCLRQKGAFDAVQQPLCRYHRRFASPAGEARIRINDDRYSLHPRTKQFVNDFCCLVRLFRAKHVCRGNVVVAARQRCWPLCASRTRPSVLLVATYGARPRRSKYQVFFGDFQSSRIEL